MILLEMRVRTKHDFKEMRLRRNMDFPTLMEKIIRGKNMPMMLLTAYNF